MRLLVTGGAGFIGSNFVYYILNTHPDYSLVCLDKLTYAGNLSNLSNAFSNPRFSFIKGDIADNELIRKVFESYRFDAVINFAAETHVDRSIQSPQIFTVTNVLGTQVLLDACLKYNVPRFHQVSTDEVYGDLPLERDDLSFCEDSSLRPSNPYSASKAAADLLALSYYRTYGMFATISRCGNNYGPYQFPEKLIPLLIFNALRDMPLPIYGNGQNVRDWIYVADHCAAIDLIVRKGRPGQVYNVGAKNEIKNIDMAKIILQKLKKSESLITFVADRKGHDLRYSVNPQKIMSQLNWTPKIDFEKGITQTVLWYKDNVKWLNDIKSGRYRAINDG